MKPTLIPPPNDPLWQECDPDQHRQYIDARSCFTAWEDARKAVADFTGSMRWKHQERKKSGIGAECLIRTSAGPKKTQKTLGWRSDETEAIYKDFHERKERAKLRLSGLSESMVRHQRMNHALYVGRAPRELVDTLNRQYRSGSTDYIVADDYALYAYEAAIGIRIRDDLLGRGKIAFRSNSECSAKVSDLRPLFSSIIISRSGHIAGMYTISPLSFIEYKRFEAVQSGRSHADRERDLIQADLVEKLVEEYLLDRWSSIGSSLLTKQSEH